MKNKKIISYERKKSRCGYLFISMWLIGFIVFFLIPLITSIGYSFNDVTIETGYVKLTPVGFKNYIDLFVTDEEFMPAFTKTLTKVITQTPMICIFSLFIAIILNQKFRGRTMARAVFFIPVIISGGVVMNIINGDAFLGMIMSGQRSGMLFEANSIYEGLVEFGLNSLIADWIMNMVNSIFKLVWSSGVQIILFLSGLQSINPSLYEVGKVEGANAWVSFWKITLPMISPMILVNLMYTIIDNFISYSNEMFQLIQKTTSNIQFDSAAAMAVINFFVIFVLIAVVYLVVNKHVYYAVD